MKNNASTIRQEKPNLTVVRKEDSKKAPSDTAGLPAFRVIHCAMVSKKRARFNFLSESLLFFIFKVFTVFIYLGRCGVRQNTSCNI